jgi:hypothetical protein
VWRALRGHGEQGAILVRPDGHVAYRSAGLPPDPRAALGDALAVALGTGARSHARQTMVGGRRDRG